MVVVSRDVGRKVIASNRRPGTTTTILDTYEAGIVLAGTEVKSLREGRASLVDAFAQEQRRRACCYGLHIAEYAYGTWTNHAPRRTRKLLLHRAEIDRILDKLREGGVTLVPLSMYFNNGWAKVELGLARGSRLRQAAGPRRARRQPGDRPRVGPPPQGPPPGRRGPPTGLSPIGGGRTARGGGLRAQPGASSAPAVSAMSRPLATPRGRATAARVATTAQGRQPARVPRRRRRRHPGVDGRRSRPPERRRRPARPVRAAARARRGSSRPRRRRQVPS